MVLVGPYMTPQKLTKGTNKEENLSFLFTYVEIQAVK